MKHRKLYLALAGLLVAQQSALAWADADSHLAPVVVTGSPVHGHTAFELPTQISVLSDDELRLMDRVNLGASLERLPGVNNQGTGAATGKSVIRGLSGERVKVLVNGAVQDFQNYGVQHTPPVESLFAERIEVIRGPQGVLFGGSALGGAVNLVAPRFVFAPAGETQQSAQFDAGLSSNPRGALLGAQGAFSNEDWSLQLGVVGRKAGDIVTPRGKTAVNDPDGEPSDRPLIVGSTPFTNHENTAFTLGLANRQSWGQLETRYRYWQSKQNILAVHEEHDDHGDEEYEAEPAGHIKTQHQWQLGAEIDLAHNWLLKPSYTYTDNRLQESHDTRFEDFGNHHGHSHHGHDHDDLDLRNQRHDINLVFQHPQIGPWEGEFGIELMRKNQRLVSGELAPSGREEGHSFYLFEEADMGRWLWQLGARHDVQRLTANLSHDNEHFIEDLEVFDGSNNQQTFANTSLAAGVTYRIAPAWAVAANLSQGYRAPSLYELYAGGSHSGVNAVQIGDPNLKAERALNIDLSLRYQTQPSQWQVTVYQKHIDNYIYLANTGRFRDKEDHYEICTDPSDHGCIREMKAEQTNGVIQGLEMEWQQTWSANWHTYANLELISGRDRDNSRDLALIPANNALVELQYHFTQLSWQESAQVRFGVKAVAARKSPGDFEPFGQFDDEPIGVASTDAYSVWHLAYQTDWRVKGQTWQVTARVDNLFDTAYRDYLNTYKGFAQDLGRNVAVSARLSF